MDDVDRADRLQLPSLNTVLAMRKTYEEAFGYYQKREFLTAARTFRRCRDQSPLDRPSQIMMDRCLQYDRDGVPDSWNGINVLTIK